MTTFYRIDLEAGITVEERPTGTYKGSPEWETVVFKDLRKAKKAFTDMVRDEIAVREMAFVHPVREQHILPLRRLLKDIQPLSKRATLRERAYSPPPA